MPKHSQLEKRERRFARELVLHNFDGTKAASAAKYKSPRMAASRLMTRVTVQKYIAEEVARLNKKIDIDQEEILKSARAAALLDITEIVEITGKSVMVKDLKKVPVELRRTIQEIEEKEHGLKIKFESKAAARDFIARVKGWNKEQPFTGGARIIFMNAGMPEEKEE